MLINPDSCAASSWTVRHFAGGFALKQPCGQGGLFDRTPQSQNIRHGVAERFMDALASVGVNVILTSQGSSEHSITAPANAVEIARVWERTWGSS